jgi:hypothetical protein
MEKRNDYKIEINLSLLEDMAKATELLFNLLLEKDLTDDDLPVINEVAKLTSAANETLRKNIDDTKSPFNKISFN